MLLILYSDAVTFIDSHCHLNFPDLYDNLGHVLKRAHKAGVSKIVVVGTTVEDSKLAVEIAKKHPDRCVATVGVHPHEALTTTEEMFQVIEQLAQNPVVRAIGEVGLDFARGANEMTRAKQIEDLKRWITIAQNIRKPLVIHCRGEYDLFIETVHGIQNLPPFVAHCFVGTIEQAQRLIALGGLISLTGIVTFDNAQALQTTVRELPLDKLMLETDAPFLAPVPHRGKPNEPSYIPLIAAKVAELKGVVVQSVAATTTQTAIAFFHL